MNRVGYCCIPIGLEFDTEIEAKSKDLAVLRYLKDNIQFMRISLIKSFEKFEYLDYEEFRQELKKFTSNHLITMVDDGFNIYCMNTTNSDYVITIKRPDNSIYKWNDTKDDMIPFLEILKKNYKIQSIQFEHIIRTRRAYTVSKDSFDIDDIISEKVDKRYIKLIEINIKR